MDRLFFSIWTVIACLQGVHPAQWSDSFPDGATVDACAGDVNATFPWAITLGSEEEIASSDWFYHARSEEMIAFFTHEKFVAMPTFSQRVEQVGELGLILSHVTEGDAGNYSVEVMVRNLTSGMSVTLRHSAVLLVYTQSEAARDATVSVSQKQTAVYNNVTGQYHVQLSCSGQGRQPSAVIWTLPSGDSRVVSTVENGHFLLLVPNPVFGGNYTCRVHDDSPAATCLPSNSPALQGRSLYLDALTARLTLIEAGQQQHQTMISEQQAEISQLKAVNNQLQTENNQQQTEIAHLSTNNNQLKTEFAQLQARVSRLDAENSQLKNTLNDQLHDTANNKVAFHACLSFDAYLHDHERLILPNVLYNQGHGYSNSTAIFTAPYGGTYAFLVTARPIFRNYCVSFQIMADGRVINQCGHENYCDYYTRLGEPLSCNAVQYLRAGQTVWVESVGRSNSSMYGSAFSGFLLSLDP